jgi:signal transduction histidine kinase
LLERLESAFDAQRRFVANASHELRTPLTATRAVLELALSDPHATVATFREACGEALEEGEHQERLIDALLALAQGQRGLDAREQLDLAGLTLGVLNAHEAEADAAGVLVDASLLTAPIFGDRPLVQRLISNLVENAIQNNTANGTVKVSVESRAGRSAFAVSNTGPQVPPGEIERLLQPFQRLRAERTVHHEGVGLGLSIVAAIAAAHEATLEIRPGAHGGLEVEVRFPPAGRMPGRAIEERDGKEPLGLGVSSG